jgi:hypothetical protein
MFSSLKWVAGFPNVGVGFSILPETPPGGANVDRLETSNQGGAATKFVEK